MGILKKQGIPCLFQGTRTVLCSPTWDVKQSTTSPKTLPLVWSVVIWPSRRWWQVVIIAGVPKSMLTLSYGCHHWIGFYIACVILPFVYKSNNPHCSNLWCNPLCDYAHIRAYICPRLIWCIYTSTVSKGMNPGLELSCVILPFVYKSNNPHCSNLWCNPLCDYAHIRAYICPRLIWCIYTSTVSKGMNPGLELSVGALQAGHYQSVRSSPC